MVIFSATGNDSRCSVHDLLNTIQIEIWQSSENAVAVVDSRQHTALLTSILEVSVVSERLMVRASRSALKHALVSLAKCDRRDRSRSIRSPRFHTDVAS